MSLLPSTPCRSCMQAAFSGDLCASASTTQPTADGSVVDVLQSGTTAAMQRYVEVQAASELVAADSAQEAAFPPLVYVSSMTP